MYTWKKLELLCTNNKLMFKYVMKLVTDLGVSSSPKQMLCFPNAMAHEGNLLFYFHFFSSLFIHVFASTVYYAVQSLALKFPTH